jgi:class 3 adenylate cyclase
MNLVTYLNRAQGILNDKLNEQIELVDSGVKVPTETNIKEQVWKKVSGVAVVFIDLVDSTKIDFENKPKESAKVYELFTGTLVKTLFDFDAAYVDIKGDGAFAVFDGEASTAKAFLAAETFRTICDRNIKEMCKQILGEIEIRTRTGLSFGNTIVKRIGVPRKPDFQNEVWAYRTINGAAKLCSLADPNSLVASEAAYNQIENCEWIVKSCGCTTSGTGQQRSPLWKNLSDEKKSKFPLVSNGAMTLSSLWCKKHGDGYFKKTVDQFNLTMDLE